MLVTNLAVELVASLEPDVLALSEIEYGPSQFDSPALHPLREHDGKVQVQEMVK